MTDSSTPKLVNDPYAKGDSEALDSSETEDTSLATGGCVWDISETEIGTSKSTMHGDSEEAALKAKKEDKLKELAYRKAQIDNMKTGLYLEQGVIAEIEKELGLPSSVHAKDTSVLGVPIQQFTKATFNDASLIPSKFTGKRLGIDSLNRWIEQFNKYAKFKEMDDNTKFEFFKLLMVDEAADWAASLEEEDEIDFEDLFERFRERFLLTDIQKWQQARSVGQRQQKPNESVDEYITWVKNRAKNLPEIGENQLVYIIISGLRRELRADVLKAKHDTIEEVKKIARISEIAERETGDNNATIANLEKTIATHRKKTVLVGSIWNQWVPKS